MSEDDDPAGFAKLLIVPVGEIRALSRGFDPQRAVVSGTFEVAADLPKGVSAHAVASAVAAVTLGADADDAGDMAAFLDWPAEADDDWMICVKPGCPACAGRIGVGIVKWYGLTARRLCEAVAAHVSQSGGQPGAG